MPWLRRRIKSSRGEQRRAELKRSRHSQGGRERSDLVSRGESPIGQARGSSIGSSARGGGARDGDAKFACCATIWNTACERH
jgi:hypothetical protein